MMLLLIVNFKVCTDRLLVFVFEDVSPSSWLCQFDKCLPLVCVDATNICVCVCFSWAVVKKAKRTRDRRTSPGMTKQIYSPLGAQTSSKCRQCCSTSCAKCVRFGVSVFALQLAQQTGKTSWWCGTKMGKGLRGRQAISFMNSYVSYRYNELCREYMGCIDSAALP